MDPAVWAPGCSRDGVRLHDFALRAAWAHRVEARRRAANLRSNMALRMFGARKEGTLRAAFISDGTNVDRHLWAGEARTGAAMERRECRT